MMKMKIMRIGGWFSFALKHQNIKHSKSSPCHQPSLPFRAHDEGENNKRSFVGLAVVGSLDVTRVMIDDWLFFTAEWTNHADDENPVFI